MDNLLKILPSDLAPEHYLLVLIEYLLKTEPLHWWVEFIHWIQDVQLQDLMKTNFSKQYHSNGYAAASNGEAQESCTRVNDDIKAGTSYCTSSSEEEHPLFEPDVVNSYAEPLVIPTAIVLAMRQFKAPKDTTKEERDAFINNVNTLSRSLSTEVNVIVDTVNQFQEYCYDSKNYIRIQKTVALAQVFIFLSKIYEFDLDNADQWEKVLLVSHVDI